ncbi:MAG: hypothetical protein HOP19_26775 [Acidobacteria bacterium]|nr:hypothetical protein [Acidobacteriota bacterium]
MSINEDILSPPQFNDDHEWPVWLDDKLRMAAAYQAFTYDGAPAASPEFHARSQQAVTAALAQAKMSAEHVRHSENFAPLALNNYLAELARAANVSPAFELPSHDRPQIGTAYAFGQLAKSIGMSLKQTLAHLRIGFAQQCGLQGELQALLAHQRSQRFNRNLLEAYATALTQLEKKCDPASWREFKQIEHEVCAAYLENND